MLTRAQQWNLFRARLFQSTHTIAIYFPSINFNDILSSMSTRYTSAFLIYLHGVARGNFTFTFYAEVSQCVRYVPTISTFPIVKNLVI
jgi:hypothetical protein